MRRFVALLALAALIVPAVPAASQEDLRSRTSIEPLQRLISGFAEGEDSELFLPGGAGSGVVRQFQLVVNLGGGPRFGYQDVELEPVGLPPLDGLDAVFLEREFGGTFGGASFLPPLDPWGSDDGRTDLSSVFEGWTAYGENGLIEGPIDSGESATVIWGFELEEPFDESCGATRWVGRAWEGDGIVSPEFPFTAEAIETWHPGTHGAIANGVFTRLIEFGCFEGGEPSVRAVRQREDLGVRTYGPLDLVALVRENNVVIMNTGRNLGSQFSQQFFASPTGGAPVELSVQSDAPVPLLVPNPYDELPLRIVLTQDPEESGGSSALAPPDDVDARDLLFRPGTERVVESGFQCRVLASIIFAPDLGDLGEEEKQALIFLAVYSLWAEAVISGTGIATFEVLHEDGTVETVTANFLDFTWSATVVQGPGSEDPDCNTGGSLTFTGGSIGAAAPPDDPVDEADEGGDVDLVDEGIDPDSSGAPWGLIGLALALFAIAGVTVGRRRTRTRGRDCEPERQAYAAASEAYDRARHTQEFWEEEHAAISQGYTEAKQKSENPLPRPDRELGYPPGEDGDAAYEADLEHWIQAEIDAETYREGLDEWKEALDDAKAKRDDADAAVDLARDALERARIALRECEKSGSADGGEPGSTPGDSGSQPGSKPPAKECEPDGTTKVEPERGLPFADFVVPNGNPVLLSTRMASWNRVFGGSGGLAPAALMGLKDAQIDAALADFDSSTSKQKVDPVIRTKTVRVTCGRVYECKGGTWVKTDRTARLSVTTIEQKVERISTGSKPPTKEQIKANTKQAQERMKELVASQLASTTYACQ